MTSTEHHIVQISIVIPTMGRRTLVDDCVSDLRSQVDVGLEIIVIDQEAFEKPRGTEPCVRWFKLDEPNASLARNIGLREAKGEIVLFLDDDVRIFNPHFLEKHLRHFHDPTVAGVYGQVLEVGQVPTDGPKPEVIESDWGWILLPPNFKHFCRTRNGASNNLSVRRDWALAVGGMDAWFQKGARREETEFNLRYTKRYGLFVFDPEASLTHLSADGGSRSWGRVKRNVPMHHIVGHWYFLLRTVSDRTLGAKGLALELRNIAVALLKNPQKGRNPLIFLNNAGRAIFGLAITMTRIFRGPRRLYSLDPACYREINSEYVKARKPDG